LGDFATCARALRQKTLKELFRVEKAIFATNPSDNPSNNPKFSQARKQKILAMRCEERRAHRSRASFRNCAPTVRKRSKMKRIVRVAATQMKCDWETSNNITRAEKLVREAHGKGAQIILLQELFRTVYFCQVK
jgi:ribosomal protein L44E